MKVVTLNVGKVIESKQKHHLAVSNYH